MVYDRICELICAQLWLETSEVSRDTEFVTDLGCDSLDIVELTIALEEEFGIPEITEEDLKSIKTIGDLADYAQRFE